MRNVRQLICQGFFLATLLGTNSVFANPEGIETDGPRWACWYAPTSLTVTCLLSKAPAAGSEMRTADVASKADSALPELVRTIWGSPEKLAGAGITIPLMTVPYDMDFVKTLAKSVMCSSRKDCSVSFDPNKDGMAAVRAAALEAGASEAEVMAEVMLQGLNQNNAVAGAEAVMPRKAKQRRV